MKKMKRRLLSILLCLSMVISLMPMALAAGADGFTDVNTSDWFYDDVSYVVEKGYFNGTSATSFSPQAAMTRAMFVTVLSRVDGATVDNSVSSFSDVAAGAWCAGAVEWAAENGIVTGMGDGTFAPNQSVTRQQMATFMARFLHYYETKHNVTFKATGSTAAFTDAGKIAAYAAESVALCRSYGLVNGNTDGSFGPEATSTRAQVAAVIHRLDLLLASGTTTTPTTASSSGGGGGGGGGSSSGGPGNTETTSNRTASTVTDFVEAAQADATNVTATLVEATTNPITVNDDITVVNNNATTLTLDFGSSNVGDVSVSSTSAATINIKGTGSVKSLTVNAPKATVNNGVKVDGSVTIQAVSNNTFNNTAEIGGNIVVTGPGAINDTYSVLTPVVIATSDPVAVKGNTAVVNVTADKAQVTLATTASGTAPTVTSSASEVVLTVATANTVTVGGSIAAVKVATTAPTLEITGTVEQLDATAADTLTLSGNGAVSNVTAANTNIVAASGDAPSIDTVAASGSVTLGIDATTVTAAANTDLMVEKDVSITTVEAEGNVALSGNGSIVNVDVNAASDAAVTVSSAEIAVAQVTSTGNGAVTATGAGAAEIKVVAKAAKPTGVAFNAPTAVGGTGTITGLTTAMEYKAVGDAEWTPVSDKTSTSFTPGTYQVRVAATSDKLASEAVTGTIPAAVAVDSAAVQGTPYVGQTLTAVANADATGKLSYQWSDGTSTIGTEKALTLADEQIGKTISVTISNYDATGVTATLDGKVTVDKSALKALIAKAAEVQVGVTELGDTMTAADVAKGIIFVTTAEKTALESAVTAAEEVNIESAASTQVTTQEKALRAAIDTYVKAKKVGTNDEMETLRNQLNTLIGNAEAIEVSRTDTAAVNVTPGTPWVTAEDAAAYTSAINAAREATESDAADTLSGAITALNAAITAYQKAIRNGAALDSSALDAAINAAEVNAASVVISGNGEDVLPSQTWVTEDVLKDYNAAITTAKGINASVQKANTDALTALNAATETFNDAKAAGTKDIVPPAVTATAVLTEEKNVYTVTVTANEGSSFQYQVGDTVDGGWTVGALTEGTGSFTYTATAIGDTTIYVKVTDASLNSTVVPVVIVKAEAETDAVASIGSAKYKTLADALEAVSNGQTIKLMKDIDLNGETWSPLAIANGSSLTIDGAGHTISGLKTTTGSLEPKEGSVVGDGSSCYYYSGFIGPNKGTVTIKDLTFSGAYIQITEPEAGVADHGGSSVAVVCGYNGGTLNLENVKVTGSSVKGYTKLGGLVGQQAGTLNVKTCEVSDCTFAFDDLFTKGDEYTWGANAGAIFGTSWTTKDTVHNNLMGIKLENNTFNTDVVTSYSQYTASTYPDVVYGAYSSQADSYKYGIYHEIGTWTVPSFTTDSFKCISGTDLGYTSFTATIGAPQIVAEVDGFSYVSLQDAFDAAASGDTIKLVHDVTLESSVTVPANTEATLDLNGKTIETNGNTIQVNGDLTVGGGTITNSQTTADKDNDAKTMFQVASTGSLNITGGTYNTATFQIVNAEGDVTITGGSFNCTNEDAGSAYDSKSVIAISGTGVTLTMTAGTIYAPHGEDYCGLYGVYVSEGATAILGDEDTQTGPSITTDLAPIGMNNFTSPGTIEVYGGTYTSNTGSAGKGGKFDCVVYLPAQSVVEIHGGTFTAEGNASHVISIPYDNVDVKLTITGGTFTSNGSNFYAGTQQGAASGTPSVVIAGGGFSSDPSAYVAEGYEAIGDASNGYVVDPKVATTSLDELEEVLPEEVVTSPVAEEQTVSPKPEETPVQPEEEPKTDPVEPEETPAEEQKTTPPQAVTTVTTPEESDDAVLPTEPETNTSNENEKDPAEPAQAPAEGETVPSENEPDAAGDLETE